MVFLMFQSIENSENSLAGCVFKKNIVTQFCNECRYKTTPTRYKTANTYYPSWLTLVANISCVQKNVVTCAKNGAKLTTR